MKIIETKKRKIGLYKETPHYNSAEFTVPAQHFKEFGTYTRYPVNLSPNSRWYKYWVEEARRCIYGYDIGRDAIPGYYYWYLNYCPIEKVVNEEDKEKENIFILPDTAMNYSLKEKYRDDPDISLVPPTEEEFEEYDSFRAERITGFPDFWDSDYDCFWYLDEAEESGEHAVALKTRDRGYSFKAAGMMNRNFYLIPRSKSFAFASDKEYLISDGLLTKTWDMMGHIENNTPWGKRKSKVDSMMHKRASYLKMTKGIQTELGFGSEIIGVTFKNNPDKGRGKRGKLIIWEEFGTFLDGLIAWNISLRSTAHGRRTYGLSWALGTGGTDIEYLMALEQLYLRGGGYRVHMIPNKIEPELGYDKTGFFVGEQHNHEIATDEDGNSDEKKALKYIEIDRKKVLEETKNREMYARYCAEAPIKPSEALNQIGDNIFPVDLLKQQKAYLISHKETVMDAAWIGSLGPDPENEGVIRWSLDDSLSQIDHYPHSDITNLNGCIVIWEPPITNRDGTVPYGLYISGNDKYDHDKSTTESLGSTFIMHRPTERIVAEYTGRPQLASMFYLNNMYLLLYYNAIQNFENNLQGLRNYMRNKRKEHFLCDIPELIMAKIEDKRVLTRGKGTPGTTPIKKYGRELMLEWLMREAEPGTGLLNLHKIKSVALIDEMIYYTSKREDNFDRIDAMLYLMILHENLWEHIPKYDQDTRPKIHPFFSENPLFSKNQLYNKKGIVSTDEKKDWRNFILDNH